MPSKPIDIAGLRKRGVDVSVPFFGAEITVTYDPITVISPAFRDEWEKRRKELQGELSDWQAQETERLRQFELDDEFPHVEQLRELGMTTLGDVPSDVVDLWSFDDITPVQARQIVTALNNDERIDHQEFGRRRREIWAAMALLLIRDWNLEESGQALPLEVESFEGLGGLAEDICREVWRHANSLGNPSSSRRTS